MNSISQKDFQKKISFILSKNPENKNDLKLKEVMQMIFNTINTLFTSENKCIQKLIFRFIDLIYYIFNENKEERDILYNTDVYKIKNKTIQKIIEDLEEL